MTGSLPLDLVLIGAGPTASSLLERLSANAAELLGGRALRIHLVDPHRAGTGRVWRPDLHRSMWMNSMAEDVTMFTDESVQCAGPVRPGPSLHEWAQYVDDATLAALASPDVAREIRCLSGMSFPTRLVQSVYLDWFHRGVLQGLPAWIEVVVHQSRAVDLFDEEGSHQQIVVLDDGEQLHADVVVLALGHLDSYPDAQGTSWAAFAEEHGLVFVPPGHTVEQDLSVLEPGADVIAYGFGQAFTDLAILLTEGRGGKFVERGDGSLGYVPSGLEPILHVGSRRGVPYRSKIDYRLQAPLAPLPRFLDDDAISTLLAQEGPIDFRRDVLPLVLKEVAWSYYHELFHAHPERVTVTWDEFARRFGDDDSNPVLSDCVADAVPDPADRLDLLALDRPLAGLRFDSLDALQQHVQGHVAADVARRTDSVFSADLGAFMGLLVSFGALGRLSASGRLSNRSRVEDLGGWWFSFFMYYASGPPPARLRQFLALAEAGLLKYLGADLFVEGDAARGRFVARSSSHPETVEASVLVDARIAIPSVSRTTDQLLRRLHDRGEALEEVVADADGWSSNTGKVVVVGPDLNLAVADGSPHPRRHALGVFTNRPAAGAFARPRTNAPSFRQNDHVARSILLTLAGIDSQPSRRATVHS